MRILIACVAAAAAVSAPLTPAHAAGAPPQAASSGPSARQLELTRRYVDLTMTDQFGDVIREMIGDEYERDATMPADERAFLVDLTTELMTDMVPRMIDELVQVYAAAYTEAEMEALIAFYDTEVGRSIAAKAVQLMPEENRAMMSVMPQVLDKMASRMCQHYGCGPGELEVLQREMRAGAGFTSSPAPAPPPKPVRR